MNKVFLFGKVWKAPEVSCTPRGRKIIMFPIWIEEGNFAVDIIYAGESVPRSPDSIAGSAVMVAGELVKAKLQAREVLKVKASKILWMEE